MTGNIQIDHRKYFNFFYIDHRLQGVFNETIIVIPVCFDCMFLCIDFSDLNLRLT